MTNRRFSTNQFSLSFVSIADSSFHEYYDEWVALSMSTNTARKGPFQVLWLLLVGEDDIGVSPVTVGVLGAAAAAVYVMRCRWLSWKQRRAASSTAWSAD